MEQTIKWHYIAEEGLPKLKDNKTHSFMICYRAELAESITCNGQKMQIPTGKYIELCTVALIQKKEEQRGFVYTPAKEFYWGPYIYATAYAWAEIPEAIPFKHI